MRALETNKAGPIIAVSISNESSLRFLQNSYSNLLHNKYFDQKRLNLVLSPLALKDEKHTFEIRGNALKPRFAMIV
jgi:hypothetical protein